MNPDWILNDLSPSSTSKGDSRSHSRGFNMRAEMHTIMLSVPYNMMNHKSAMLLGSVYLQYDALESEVGWELTFATQVLNSERV